MSRAHIVVMAKGYLPDDGGIERYSTEIARAYSAIGHRCTVITQTSHGPGIRRDGSLIVLDLGSGNQAMLLFKFAFALRKVVRRGRPSVLHATTWRLSLPAIGLRAIPLIVTVHGREVFVLNRFLRPLMRYALKSADRVVVVSEAIKAAADRSGLRSRGWSIVWNGASYPMLAQNQLPRPSSAESAVRIATLCRLVPRKNVVGAITAVSLLIQQGYRNFHYEIAGNGPDYDHIAKLIDELNLSDYVTLLGRVPDEQVPEIYARSDIFLHPQIDIDGDVEGFGLVIADAMTFGCVVVAGRDGGPADFIRDSETGILVDGRDHDAIASALAKLLQDRAARAAIGSRAKRWALENLRWTKAAETGVQGLIDPADTALVGFD